MTNDINNLKYVEVPMIVLLDEDISSTAKLLMGLITTLTMKEGFCYASNRYLSNIMKVSRRTITSCITAGCLCMSSHNSACYNHVYIYEPLMHS